MGGPVWKKNRIDRTREERCPKPKQEKKSRPKRTFKCKFLPEAIVRTGITWWIREKRIICMIDRLNTKGKKKCYKYIKTKIKTPGPIENSLVDRIEGCERPRNVRTDILGAKMGQYTAEWRHVPALNAMAEISFINHVSSEQNIGQKGMYLKWTKKIHK